MTGRTKVAATAGRPCRCRSFGGTFTTFTFIAPMLTQVSGLDARRVPALLILLGFGMFLGSPAGGRLADWNLTAAVRITLALLIVVLALVAIVMPDLLLMVGAVFLFGFALFATVAPLQMQAMAQAADAPILSSAFNIAAFNLGNAGGAWAGGWALITRSRCGTCRGSVRECRCAAWPSRC